MTIRDFLKKLILPVAAVGLMIAILAAAPSFAWYREIASNFGAAKVSGTIRADYFERGSGTRDDPFIIHTPVHFYNFAWLQYLGYFNDEVVYFELCADTAEHPCLLGDGIPKEDGVRVRTLDMGGRVLPPVGTAQYPFIGRFEGNGVAITNMTVSNSTVPDDFYEFPIKDGKTAQKNGELAAWQPGTDSQIAGVFGVVGSYNGKGTNANDATGVQDVYLDNIIVETTTTATVVGIAAGYVNAPVSNIGVSNSTIKVGSAVTGSALSQTDKVSNYSVIGYCEAAYRGYASTVEAKTTTTEPYWGPSPSAPGEGKKWGGSIDMRDIHDRLVKVQDAASDQIRRVTHEVQTVDETAPAGTPPTIRQTTTMDTYTQSFGNFRNEMLPSSGSFSFSKFNTTGFSEQYLFLYGRDDSDVAGFTKTVEHITLKNEFVDAYRISSGSNYLNHTGTTVGNSTSPNSAQKWALENADNGKHYIYYYEEGRKYYLNNNNGNLLITQSDTAQDDTTAWTVDLAAGKISAVVDGADFFLAYDGGWKLVSPAKYKINFGTHYLSLANRAPVDRDNANATLWTFSTVQRNPYGSISATINGKTYYLNCSQSGLTVADAASDQSATRWTNDNGQLYCTIGTPAVRYYLVCDDDGNWSAQPLKYRVSYNGNGRYLVDNDGTVGGTPTESAATEWIFSNPGTNPSGTMYSGNRYLTITRSLGFFVWNYSLGLGDTPGTWENNGGKLSIGFTLIGTTDAYLRMNGTTWEASTTNDNNTLTFTPTVTPKTLTFPAVNDPEAEMPEITWEPTQLQVQTRSANTTEPSDYPYDTWFPLSVQAKSKDEDGNAIAGFAYDPNATNNDNNSSIAVDAQRNTGYIISGSNYHDTVLSRDWSKMSGDIRVSYYGMQSNLQAALSGHTYGTGNWLEVLTVTPYTAATRANGKIVQRISDSFNQNNNDNDVSSTLRGFSKNTPEVLGLTKYNDEVQRDGTTKPGARKNLDGTFRSSNNIYGLHFMDAAISKDDVVIASSVAINGQEINEPYPLPRHSIDFNLAEDGRITFFAGTYFNVGQNDANDSFFSLHKIERNPLTHEILSIRMISKVCENSAGEIYYVYDGETGYPASEVVFDLDWIMKPAESGVDFVNRAVYYFEIPAVAGEYALGSVPDHNGAYLFYLDISANNTEKMAWIQKITEAETTRTYEFPLGIDIVEHPGGDIGITPSATIRLPVDARGTTVSIRREGDTIYYTGPPSADSTYTATLADGEVIILSSTAHISGADANGTAVYSTQGGTEITSDNQNIQSSITLVDELNDELNVVPVRTDVVAVEHEEEIDPYGVQPLSLLSMDTQSTPAMARSMMPMTMSLGSGGTTQVGTFSLQSTGSTKSSVKKSASRSKAKTQVITAQTPADQYTWSLLGDASLVTWVQEKTNAAYLLETLSAPASAEYASLQARLRTISDPSLKAEVTGRLDDLARGGVESVMQATTDDSDEAFCAWVLDPANASSIRNILQDPESAAYAELFDRLNRVVSDSLYFEVFEYLQQLLIVDSNEEELTDEEFAVWLTDEANAESIREILNDAGSAFHDALYERVAAVEDAELKATLEAKIEELLQPPEPEIPEEELPEEPGEGEEEPTEPVEGEEEPTEPVESEEEPTEPDEGEEEPTEPEEGEEEPTEPDEGEEEPPAEEPKEIAPPAEPPVEVPPPAEQPPAQEPPAKEPMSGGPPVKPTASGPPDEDDSPEGQQEEQEP